MAVALSAGQGCTGREQIRGGVRVPDLPPACQPAHATRELQRLSAAGDNEDDLLTLIKDNLDALGEQYHRLPKAAEGYRVKLVESRGRALFVKLNKGPEGSPGETYDIDTEESIETTERQAQLSGLRGLFVIPKDSYYGLLFVERVGIRHLKEVLTDVGVPPVLRTGTVCQRHHAAGRATGGVAVRS